jgi:hypothetical protein
VTRLLLSNELSSFLGLGPGFIASISVFMVFSVSGAKYGRYWEMCNKCLYSICCWE